MKTEASDAGARQEQPWRAVMRRVVALGVVAPLVSLSIYGVSFAASVAVGAALAVANLWLVARGVSAFVAGEPATRYTVGFVLKFSVVIAALYLLFDARFVQGVPLLIGLAALPVGILLSQLSPNAPIKRG
jgi:hypothetical protein